MPRKAAAHILPDRLAADQRVWFVGTAAGPMSAAVGAYYAHPGNRFWRSLHETGITPRLFAPHEFPELLPLGIGLTDFCKTGWGVDADIARDAFDAAGFRRKVARLKPRTLAFTSKMAASLWLERTTARIATGQQVHELVTQLRAEAGARQVEGARLALAENGACLEGIEEAVACISILAR